MTHIEDDNAKHTDLGLTTQLLCEQFLAAISKRFPRLEEQPSGLLAAGDALLNEQAHLIVDEAARSNLRLATLVLVVYRALQSTLAQQELIQAIQQAFCEPYRQEMLAGVQASLEQTADPLSLIAQVSRDKEQYVYGPSFTFQRLQDDQFAYLVNVKRCLWHTFFVQQGTPELTPVFCAFDLNWIEAVNPAQHGFRIERPTALGWGHDQCRFWHIRTQNKLN